MELLVKDNMVFFLKDWEEGEEEGNDHSMRIVNEHITINNIK